MAICKKHQKLEDQNYCGWCESIESEDKHTRDEFAEAALQALLPVYAMQSMQMKMTMAATEMTDTGNIGTTGKSSLTFDDFNHDEVATEAYLVADAMMRARLVKGHLNDELAEVETPKPCLGCLAAGLEHAGLRCKVHSP